MNAPMTPPIAILGAGKVGASLAETLVRHDQPVVLGVRPSAEVSDLLARLGALAAATSVERAVHDADVLFLCVPAKAALEVLQGAGDLAGKILVDCTNPVGWHDGPIYAPPFAGSVAAELQQAFPTLRVVKGFNGFGAEVHRAPELGGHGAQVFLASDDPTAKREVAALARHIGFDPVDAGPLRNAALLEAMAVLWIHLAVSEGYGREWAFAMGRR